MPRVLELVVGIGMIAMVLLDAFETVVLPRRVTRPFRLTALFYGSVWPLWKWIAGITCSGRRREMFLSFFGPLSLILLLAAWAFGLVLGFGFLQYAIGPVLVVNGHPTTNFWDALYMSGSTFFTLGLGDVLPKLAAAKFLTIVECALGLGFLGLIIGYLPVLYEAFSDRERSISFLDARAGSPPTAFEVLRRAIRADNAAEVVSLLREFEGWAANILESHISYPVLCLYRSQHDNQSWLAALVTILDVSSLVMVGVDGIRPQQAQLTFAMARHAVVDLTQIFNTPPIFDGDDRLAPEKLIEFRKALREHGVILKDDVSATGELTRLRHGYEPYAKALATQLMLTLPPFKPEKLRKDNWQTSAWKKLEGSQEVTMGDVHF